jgi:predicted RNase H-like HicB family nuclease
MVYWSDEDQHYVGLCPDLFFGGTHGDDPEQVFKNLRMIVEDVVESYKAEGKPLPEPRDLVPA